MVNTKIRQESTFVFRIEGNYQIYSPLLESAEVVFDGDDIAIADGIVSIKAGMRWRSLTMASHTLLVFFGASPLGELSQELPYGVPTASRASVLRHQLIRHRKALGLTRRQVADEFSNILQRSGYPLARFVGFLASCFMPRRGWMNPD